MRLSSNDGRPRVEFGPVVGCLVFLPLMVVGAGLSIPYSYAQRLLWRRRARRFEVRLTTMRRTLALKDFEKKLEAKEGTYIWECRSAYKGPSRLWWTSDDIYAMSPFPIVDHLTMSTDPTFEPFVRWCFRNYTSPITGKGILVVMPSDVDRIIKQKLQDARGVDVASAPEAEW